MKYLFIFLVMLVLFSGCISDNDLSVKTNDYFNISDVNAQIISDGSEVVVEYEPVNLNYEDQIISDWGKIFGILSSNYPESEKYVIVQMFDSKEILRIEVKSSDLFALNNNLISMDEFKKRLMIDS